MSTWLNRLWESAHVPSKSALKVVLSLYEDFLCPVCRAFEFQFGASINQLINSGAIAADYYMVALLDRPENQNYSSRAGGAAYCVAEEEHTLPDKPTFRLFHAALYAQQPSETATTFPTNAQLIEVARQAGLIGDVAKCVNSGHYADLSSNLAVATKVTHTPAVRINGEEYQY